MTRTLNFLGTVLLLVAAPALSAPTVTYEAAVGETRWQLHASVFQCQLVHPVQIYGQAVFSHRAGEEPRFYLRQWNRQFAAGQAEVSVLEPPWRSLPDQRPLGQVPVTLGDYPVQLDWRESQMLVSQLQRGLRLSFEQAAWYGDGQPVQVLLEPVGFRPGYQGFLECGAGLLPANYDQIARTAIYFGSGTDELPDREMEKLDHLALYVLADDRVLRIFVDGHTDGVGLRAENLELSEERANMVTGYLLDRGVPADLIITRWHGERYPVASNRTAEGRAQNRRVTLRVDRSEHFQSAATD